MPTGEEISHFMRWQQSGGAERSNYQGFLIELCDLLPVPRPDPAVPDPTKNRYTFEHSITVTHADGSTSTNFIDLYKHACFVLETKQGIEAATSLAEVGSASADALFPPPKPKRGHGIRGSKSFDDALIRAKGQAEAYVRSIPDDNPPFVIVVDVGHSIELYSDFSRLGKTYVPFLGAGRDPHSHRIYLKDLEDEAVRARLAKVWTDPLSLDPSRLSAKVTRDIAAKLALLAKSLEAQKHHPEVVAHFLMRCLFTLFAEDVKLIKDDAFTRMLESLKGRAGEFKHMLPHIWRDMDTGTEFSPTLRQKLLRFNGGLFEETQALDLNEDQLKILIDAAHADWKDVEPAIFGTLLERALHPDERHKLGAHYTPRAYVERLVLPTVIEPLRDDWKNVQSAAFTLANAGKRKEALDQLHAFLKQLCNTYVLDPACGSGNFLYVTLEHLKRLEAEVRDTLHLLGESQLPLEYTGLTVDPHQLLGLEINPRAAAIADLVLWIGYLQWHFRTQGNTTPAEPVLRKFDNIKEQDAVLAYDKKELALDDNGKPLTYWDGNTHKKHRITGEDVPDDTARTPIYHYVNPRKAEWPHADFVVGNPPFIGNKRMRDALGDGYAAALRAAHPDVSESADYVMYWWNHAAGLARQNRLRRFGLITTNSITQTFNRHVVADNIDTGVVKILFAIPDHPWVDAAEGASVRIAMTVGAPAATDSQTARLQEIVTEKWPENSESDSADVIFEEKLALQINADLTVGTNVTTLDDLSANESLSNQGVTPLGEGFRLSGEELQSLRYKPESLPPVIKRYIIGRDLVQAPQERFIIDLFGLTQSEARRQYPDLFQIVLDRVKPERDQKKRDQYRERWWVFAEPRRTLRPAIFSVPRYIATCRTAKHRIFVYVGNEYIPDAKVVAIGLSDAFYLGVLSSRPHTSWALRTGAFLEDRPNYNHADCFNKFPFPDCSAELKQKIRDLAESLDVHRKRQQSLHPDLTLTDMYNVLEKLRKGDPLTAKDKTIHDHGLISVLKQLHDDLDAAVFEAYGWSPTLTDDQILSNLVALNHQRHEEEQNGIIRYLRPDFQNPKASKITQQTLDLPTPKAHGKPSVGKPKKLPWPKSMPDQFQALRSILQQSDKPLLPKTIASHFKKAPVATVQELLDSLLSLGQARKHPAGTYTK